MPALNRVQLIGRLGKDPESRFTPTGKKVVHFSLAVSNRWKSAEGEAKESTEWVNIEAWGRLGEICQQYLHKGSLVFLEGRLKTDKSTTKAARPNITPRWWPCPCRCWTASRKRSRFRRWKRNRVSTKRKK